MSPLHFVIMLIVAIIILTVLTLKFKMHPVMVLFLTATFCGLASGKTGQAAGEGLFDWSQKNADDFRRRKQSPYFDGVKEWTMPI